MVVPQDSPKNLDRDTANTDIGTVKLVIVRKRLFLALPPVRGVTPSPILPGVNTILGYGQKGRKKRSAGSGGVVGGLVASMEKFLSCRTPETQIEGVDVWHLLQNHIDGTSRLLVCGSIYFNIFI